MIAATLFAHLLMSGMVMEQAPTPPCQAPSLVREADAAEVVRLLREQKRQVVTFLGYSDADYEDRDAMLRAAGSILETLDPARTIVNIGATASGVGGVYEVAKRGGFTTSGVVSVLARNEKVPLSPCVDIVLYVKDDKWGGLIEGKGLSPTSRAMVDVSDRLVAIGGGDVSRDEYLTAQKEGKPVTFVPAELNHANAQKRAAARKQPAPDDFRGALGAALAAGQGGPGR